MKKLLGILVLGLLLSGNAYASKIGKGEIQLSDKVVENFIKFLRNEYGVSFVVTPDGSYSTYGICGIKVWINKGEILSKDPYASEKKQIDQGSVR